MRAARLELQNEGLEATNKNVSFALAFAAFGDLFVFGSKLLLQN